jgi:hypothetical protein
MVNIILAALCFGGVLWWDVSSDYRKWLKGIPINHFKEGVIRSLLLVPSTLLLGLPDIISWQTAFGALLQFSVWWELFDGWYNKKRDKP